MVADFQDIVEHIKANIENDREIKSAEDEGVYVMLLDTEVAHDASSFDKILLESLIREFNETSRIGKYVVLYVGESSKVIERIYHHYISETDGWGSDFIRNLSSFVYVLAHINNEVFDYLKTKCESFQKSDEISGIIENSNSLTKLVFEHNIISISRKLLSNHYQKCLKVLGEELRRFSKKYVRFYCFHIKLEVERKHLESRLIKELNPVLNIKKE